MTGPDNRGMWHYEYAVHNRDNSRGGATLRIPICSSARIFNATVRDIDDDPSNDWTVSVSSTEVAFLAGANNALEWNTIYNFGFDADAAPIAGQVTLDQARPGPGAGFVTVNARVPGMVHTPWLGAGCGSPAPTLSPSGSPPYAAIPNPSFAFQLDGLQPGGSSIVLLSASASNLPLGSCTLYLGLVPLVVSLDPLTANPSGAASAPLPIPNNVAFEGLDLYAQESRSWLVDRCLAPST